ncbi:hypothetical protein BBJ28_00021529 [Nothophytophthora sp. Chile5]|nr:hypothetical protein BBJ28_00021529 [Nothophytophthora sp. Chile5]
MQHCQSKDFARDFGKASNERARSFSAATDESIASILSNSDRLIPDAYMPKDIQVLSQRRQRQRHHQHGSSRSSYAHSGKTGPPPSSRGGYSSQSAMTGSVRFVRNNAAAVDSIRYGVKTESSSFGYSDDDELLNPAVAANRRADNQSRLSTRDLVKSFA